MKKGILFIGLLLAGAAGFAQPVQKVVFVIADGIPADVIRKLHLPHLDSISGAARFLDGHVGGGLTHAHVGGERDGYSQTPTISAVGYNSLLTGTWVNKHNVWDNDIAAPDYNYWTIFRFFKQQYPQKKTAVYSSWEDNRTKLVGEGLAQTGSLKLDGHYDGLELDTTHFPHDKKREFMHQIDESVVDHASEGIRQEAPDLSWVYLEYTDDMGHMYGDSPEFYKAVEYMDAQMGRLWTAIKYREANFKEKWTIFITTDHGRSASNGKGHGGQSDRERATWIVTNASGLNSYFAKGNPGIVDIMPSMAHILGVTIPREQLMEVDGVSLVGPLSAVHPTAVLREDKIMVSWEAVQSKGKAKIWLATTNQFKTGGKDDYVLAATVPVEKGSATIDVTAKPSDIYKVFIEMPDNDLNRWVLVKK